jgi:hypothetical protein
MSEETKKVEGGENLTYLETYLTPHMSYPDTNTIAVCLFLDEDTKEVVKKYTDIPRGYKNDGTIHPETMQWIKMAQAKKQREAEALRTAQTSALAPEAVVDTVVGDGEAEEIETKEEANEVEATAANESTDTPVETTTTTTPEATA